MRDIIKHGLRECAQMREQVLHALIEVSFESYAARGVMKKVPPVTLTAQRDHLVWGRMEPEFPVSLALSVWSP